MANILMGIIIAFIVTFTAIPVIIKVSNLKKLFDHPDDRKLHLEPIPSLGGLGIFAGFMLSLLITTNFIDVPEFQSLIAAALVIFFLGVKDDILVLSPLKKFIGEILAAFLIVYKGGFQIHSMHGFMGIGELPHMFSLAFTVLTIVVIINSFNLIDGVDGLSGSLGLMTSLAFCLHFYLTGQVEYAVLASCLAGAVAAFLIFNYAPAKIFMGDTGSLMIGLVNAVLVIRLMELSEDPITGNIFSGSAAVGFGLLIVPLFDTLRVFAIRISKGLSPFTPDNNHVHHLLADLGFSHTAITLICVSVNIFIAGLTFLFRNAFSTTALIFFQIGVMSLLIGLLFLIRKQRLANGRIQEDILGADKHPAAWVDLKLKSIVDSENN